MARFVRVPSAKATIHDIVLQPQSAFERQQDGVYELQVSPLYILVKFDQFRGSPLDGLEAGVVPIEAVTTSFRITVVSNGRSKLQTVKRTQFPSQPEKSLNARVKRPWNQ